MKQKQKFYQQLALLIVSFVMLLTVTVAWFTQNQTNRVDALSFAAQESGSGVILYPGVVDKTLRSVEGELLTNTVTWAAEPAGMEEFTVDLENMTPGQCEYLLLTVKHTTRVKLIHVELTDADGNPVTDGAKVPLATCIGAYLVKLPTQSGHGAPGSTDAVPITLARSAETKMLSAAVFAGDLAAGEVVIGTTAAEGGAYALAFYCDGVYGQGLEDAPVGTLSGKITFNLSFAVEGAAEA